MKKILLALSAFIALIIAIIVVSINQNTTTKQKNIYIDDIIIATLLNDSSKQIKFLPTYPNNVDIHEYEFSTNDINKFENSMGVYFIDNTEHNHLKNVKNKTSLNKVLSDDLVKNDTKTIDIHYSVNVNTMKNIYKKLTKYFAKYLDQNKVNNILKAFDQTNDKLSKIKENQSTIISIHQAWNYLNLNLKNKINQIGDEQSNIIDNSEIKTILNSLNSNSRLLSETGEELSPNEQKLISKYNLKNVKIHTFEKYIKDYKEYLNKIVENKTQLSK